MKPILKLLTIIILGVTILVFYSCKSDTNEEDAILTEEASTTITEKVSLVESSLGVPLITVDELLQLIEGNDSVVIVDLRGEAIYQQSHIKGSISVLPYKIQNGEWEPPDGKVTVLY